MLGVIVPFSQRETVGPLTPSFSPSFSFDKFLSSLNSLSRSQNISIQTV